MIPELLVPMPPAIARLDRDERGFPIPFFSATVDGKRSQAIASPVALRRCIEEHLCWVCGEELGDMVCFIGGPIGMKNRVATDAATHPACAEYSVRACPFMARKEMQYGAGERLGGHKAPGCIETKPDKTGIAYVRSFETHERPDGVIFHWDKPDKVVWFQCGERCEGP